MLLTLVLGLVFMQSQPVASASFNYDEAVRCSERLRTQGSQLHPAEYRACMIAVAETYIEVEQNTLAPEKMLLADDIAKHAFGDAAVFHAGNRAPIVADQRHAVIEAIRNRQWSVDGDHVWVVYDGYLKGCAAAPAFYVAERFTIADGFIHEIVAPGIKVVNPSCGK